MKWIWSAHASHWAECLVVDKRAPIPSWASVRKYAEDTLLNLKFISFGQSDLMIVNMSDKKVKNIFITIYYRGDMLIYICMKGLVAIFT